MGRQDAKKNAPKMKGQRGRNPDSGALRQKRGDTRARTIEEEYGVDLDVPGNTRLDTMREMTGENDIRDIIKKLKK